MANMKRSDIAYHKIRELISIREYLPGDPLPEIELSNKLNMSRTPIREALHKLEDEEIIVIRPQIGAFVATVDFGQLCNLYEAREALQGMIANLLCRAHIPSEALVELKEELLELIGIEDPIERHERLTLYSNHYLEILRTNCMNPVIMKMDRTISNRIDALAHVTHVIPLYPDDAAQERLVILDAIIEKDSLTAEKLTRQHIRNIFNRIMETLKLT
ncbi:MAG: GntR family transcriptional regulator [Sphaerochaeta sp.]